MPRWTEIRQDQVRIAKISQEMLIGGIVEITLIDNRMFEGVLQRINMGNNAGQGGWQYYGECEIQTKDRQRWVIDFLDIKIARSVWGEEKAKEYENLGLIEIVDY